METANHEYYVSLEVAKLLKQAGFDWEVNHSHPNVSALDNSCSGYMEDLPFYHNLNDGKYGGLSAPTLEVAQRWLREVKGIHICVKPNEATTNCKYFVTVIISDTKWGNIQDNNRKTIMFDTYEEAQESGIKKALELILEKGK